MAQQRSASPLTALLVLGGCAWTLQQLAFMPAPAGQGRALRVARSAIVDPSDKAAENPFEIPDRKLSLDVNQAVQLGATIDQDKRGNVWQMELQPLEQQEEDAVPSWARIAAALVIVPPIVILLAKFGGSDPLLQVGEAISE